MDEITVGISELKSRLGEYLQRMRAGQVIVIMDRGRPVGRLVPESSPLEDRLRAMIEAGEAAWSGKPPQPLPPVAQSTQGSVADLIVADREN